jgi:D-alanyl-D-alanine carboxypeptidase
MLVVKCIFAESYDGMFKLKYTAITAFLFVLSCASLPAQTTTAEIALHILDSFRIKYELPGITAAIIDKNGAITDIATGYSDTASRALLTPRHKLLAGSTGKMYFAISILELAAAKKLHLDDKVNDYLGKYDWFKLLPNASLVTIRQLLNHTAGMEEYYELGDFIQLLKTNPNKEWRPEELLRYVSGRKALFPAGTSFSYADTHYLLLQAIIEEVTKKCAYDFINTTIIKKMPLQNTVPSISRKIPGLSNGYSTPLLPTKIDGAVIRNGEMVINPQFEGGGGGFASCSHDLAALVHNLMNEKLLSKEWLDEMKTEVEAANLGKGNFYGLGLQIIKGSLGTTYGHSGWFPGYMSDVEYFPGPGLTIAVQINADFSGKGYIHPRTIVYTIAGKIKNTL